MKRLLCGALLLCAPFLHAGSHAVSAQSAHHLRAVAPVSDTRACPDTPIHCLALRVIGVHAHAASMAQYGPAEFHTAYNLPCTPGGPVRTVCPTPATYGPQTVGIVDAGGDPMLQIDLDQYSQRYGLPPCTLSNGCLAIVGQDGVPSHLPASQGWEVEIALDVETVHALCQTCRIVLVEVNSALGSDLAAGVDTAVRLGATVVSNSYGGSEAAGLSPYDGSYDHPGVAITASTGDNGYGIAWPAALSHVIAVGGTTLWVNNDNTYGSEGAWSGAGSGCSAWVPANPWQIALGNYQAMHCQGMRATADVSADADPQTGALIIDQGKWEQVGGTSLASPIIASVIALAGGMGGVTNPQSVPYAHFDAGNSHDVLWGNNGSCGIPLCLATQGYDGPTGLGSPNGTSGFSVGHSTTPTPTATPVPPTATPVPPTPSPTPTPRPTPQPVYRAFVPGYPAPFL